MTDEKCKAGHEAIALLFKASLHPGSVLMSDIIAAQETLSSLLEKDDSEAKLHKRRQAYIKKRRGPAPCGELPLESASYDECILGREDGTSQTHDQPGSEWGHCCTIPCVKPAETGRIYGVQSLAEGLTPHYQKSFRRSIERSPDAKSTLE